MYPQPHIQVFVRLLFPTALFLLAGGCHEPEGQSLSPTAVRFKAEPDDFLRPDAKSPWTIEGDIGITMLDPANTDIVLDSVNTGYRFQPSTQEFLPIGESIYYPINGNDVRFTAYFPWDTPAGSTLDVDISTQPEPENQEHAQLLWSPPTEPCNKDSQGPVVLAFQRQYAKIDIRLSQGEGISHDDLTNTVVSITQMPLHADFDILEGILETKGEAGTITFRPFQTDSTRMSALAIPTGTHAGRCFQFQIGEAAFSYPIPEKQFEKGHSYAYNIRISRKDIGGLEASVEAWNDGSGSGDVQ